MTEINRFDVATHQFASGLTLIEASAGTGKTFSISYLILRMILEEGVKIDEILTVTFTNAAVDEMKSRVRDLLVEARRAYDKGPELSEDNLLEAYLKRRYDEHRASDIKRLSDALADFDSAAILTIHGFCQRTLAEYPLESGQGFDVELVSDLTELKKSVVYDFWRRCFQSTDASPEADSIARRAAALGYLVKQYTPISSVDELYDWVSNSCADDLLRPPPPAGIDLDSLDVEGLRASLAELEAWRDRHAKAVASWDVFDPLVARLDADQKGLNKTKLKGLRTKWRDNYRKLLTEEDFQALFNKNQAPNDWSTRFRDELNMPSASLLDTLDWLEANLEIIFKAACLADYREKLWPRQLEQGVLEFDDLIYNLKQAVAAPDSAIRAKLKQRYKAALIDEFQDTDSDQWGIFEHCFSETRLYLIGDPKQAIYGFRGGDVDTYLQARNATPTQRRFTLPCNYRSDRSLVEATNRLFSFVDHPFRESAGIDFVPVEPQPKADTGVPAPLKIWRWGDADLNADSQEELVLRNVVADISDRSKQKSFKSYNAFAVLVRSHARAAKYQKALLDAGIPAVIVTKNSIYATDEAQALRRLLRAIVEPTRKDLVRECIAEPIFSSSAAQYLKGALDEANFYEWMSALSQAGNEWESRGFMFAINRLLGAKQAYQNAAQSMAAERRLSNLRQIIELLQTKSQQQQLSKTELLDYLETQMQSPDKQGEEAQLRLESDDEAVSIVTLHASKGLEYEVVYLPDLYKTNKPKASSAKRVKIEGAWWLQSQKSGDTECGKRIETEGKRQLAEEDLRLVYVGVTRARNETILIGPHRSEKGNSSLDYLFGSDYEQLPPEEELAELISFADLDESAGSVRAAMEPGQLDLLAGAREFKRQLRWIGQRHSFSNMVGHENGHDAQSRGADDEASVTATESQTRVDDNLPKGAHIGNLLHDLLEYSDFGSLHQRLTESGGLIDSDMLLKLAAKHNVTELFDKRGSGADRETLDRQMHTKLSTLVREALSTPIGEQYSLADLDSNSLMKEMPFYFGLGSATAQAMNELILDSQEIPYKPIRPRELQGSLNGFVDLIFERSGRFYVADYKSNYLSAGYAQPQLEQAMIDSNYGLQGLLYTLALHRYLKYSLPGYSYEQHMGGIKYLFLRGMNGTPDAGVFSYRPSEALIERLDTLFGMGEGATQDV